MSKVFKQLAILCLFSRVLTTERQVEDDSSIDTDKQNHDNADIQQRGLDFQEPTVEEDSSIDPVAQNETNEGIMNTNLDGDNEKNSTQEDEVSNASETQLSDENNERPDINDLTEETKDNKDEDPVVTSNPETRSWFSTLCTIL